MRWIVKAGDLLDEAADVLICSANPYLNLSGGVGGEFLLRYGDEMQRQLRQALSEAQKRVIPAGEIIVMPPCGSPYQVVIHAVAIDVFYHTSIEIVVEAITKSLRLAQTQGANTIALAALATGYGRLPLSDFATAIRQVSQENWSPIETTTICLETPHRAEELREFFQPSDIPPFDND